MKFPINLISILCILSFTACSEDKPVQTQNTTRSNYVPEVINGYTLPPEPDSQINNSTLLGIDANNNGVRDDVERKIIETYKEPIKIELMMARAKVLQEVLNNPSGMALEHKNKMTRILSCELYLMNYGIEIENSVKTIKNFTYTTKERIRANLNYNQALSGGVYGSGPTDWTADKCDFDVEQMLKEYYKG